MASSDLTPPPPPGWYPNPSGPGQRYWDGQKWTDSYSQPQPNPPAVNEAGSSLGLIIAGYVFAVLIPLVGFILGIVAVTRPDKRTSRHGVWIIVVAVAAFVIYLIAIASSG